MYQYFEGLHFTTQALLAGLFTYIVTMLGASLVFFFKNVSKNVLNIMLSFAGGVMLAASVFSLLLPAIEYAEDIHKTNYIVPTIGFLVGCIFIVVADKLLDKYLKPSANMPSKKRTALLVGSITLHNIPEGMCVGVAFAGASLGLGSSTLIGAIMLAVGIGLQNFPEGVAVSLPLRKEGHGLFKSFFIGQLSGIVEPVASVLSAIFVVYVTSVLPFLLSFASGAMVGVVVSELIPEASKINKNLCTLGVSIGFAVMMCLDVALG